MQPICPSAAGRKLPLRDVERQHGAERHAVVAAHFMQKIRVANGAFQLWEQKRQRVCVVPNVRTVHPAVRFIVGASFETVKAFAFEKDAGVGPENRRLAGHSFQNFRRKRARKECVREEARFLFQLRQASGRVNRHVPRALEARAVVVGQLSTCTSWSSRCQ